MKEKMISKLIPSKTKEWLRTKFSPRSIELMKYFPYNGLSDSYMIPKFAADSADACELGLPIPPKELCVGYDDYLPSGKRQVGKMLEVLQQSGYTLEKGVCILEFGCSAGRMIRWLKDYAEQGEIWGTDISARHIFWSKQHLSPPFNFVTTTTMPHLPFEDEYFDFIYAGSVFTHIDDMADAWLLELKRILKTDGRIYITILDNHAIDLLNEHYPDSRLSKEIWSSEEHTKYVESEFGMFTMGRDTASDVFYDIDFFCKMLSPSFKVISVTQEAYGFQTAVLLSKVTENN